ncbi:unnamed protein product [Arctia plantaginis]|uniref:Uncharacterized protein n=1 Tax=Arctia plantaginis TaxID=874455 RepID=A0A8S0Z416_ARCPL|nr:unnamed protein product [Arctia plantaginis]CAB3254809.1 unnamed protein product [Arctia plantaginis]
MSYFGAISEPSTRTAWEDWDDDVLKESFPELCFQSDVKPLQDIATFIILEGRYLYNCVRDQKELEHINSVPEVSQLVTTDYVLRSLLTTKQIPRDTISNIKRLEQPNIIAGVVAGALCLREVLDKSAATLVCYIDSEEQDIHELQDILGKHKVILHVDKMKRNNLLNSNLYI